MPLLLIIMLLGCSTNKPDSVKQDTDLSTYTNTDGQGSVEKYPEWLTQDIQAASNTHFPILASTYALNWNGPVSYDRNIFETTKSVWIAGFTGKEEENDYSYYSGPFDIKVLYKNIENDPEFLGPNSAVTSIFMLESDKGAGILVPAISIDLGNGEFMAFANNQVITKSDHAGVDLYTVYPVQGIKINSQVPH